MTNASGRCFVSYSRSRLKDVSRLVRAMRDMGIPVWQDVENLAELPTEGELRRVLDSEDLASALLWITPEVEQSDWIRTLETPGILARARKGDGFFVVPVCASGVGYSDAGIALNERFSLEDLRGWNLRRIATRRLGEMAAAGVASRILSRRLAALREAREAGSPIRAYFCTRSAPPSTSGPDLVFDWRHHFEGRHASSAAWSQRILPAIATTVDHFLSEAPGRRLACQGLLPLCGGVALGAALLQPLGIDAAWTQHFQGSDPQLWSLAGLEEPVPIELSDVSGRLDGDDVAVLLSVNANVEGGFSASREELPEFRTVLHLHGPKKEPFHVASAGQALFLAKFLVQAVKRLKDETRFAGPVHLFMAGPVGLAFLIGQLSNQILPIQTYEFDPQDSGGRYRAAAHVGGVNAVAPI